MSGGAFANARLARMREIMQRHVETGRMPGLAYFVSRRGEAHADAIGTLAFGSGNSMRRDTIFRIASVTKPITAAAAMILVEEAKVRLDDPVDGLLPELKDRKVLRSLASELDDTVPARRPITLRDLLTFRAGIGAIMVFPPQYPIQKAMEEAGVAPSALIPDIPADEYMRRIGSLPLVHQPGEQWLYHTGADILGILIARASGKPLAAFLRERLFEPLGMKDTGFYVPEDKIDRLPTAYMPDFSEMSSTGLQGGSGNTMVFDEPRGRFAAPPRFESGGSGLVSTVDDLPLFGRMMLNKGKHGRERVLSRHSVELMTADHIAPEQKARSFFFEGFWDDRGWGFGQAVITRRERFRSVGSFGWDGGYGTSFWCDPAEDLIGVLLTQRVWDSPVPPAVLQDFWTAIYSAIDD